MKKLFISLLLLSSMLIANDLAVTVTGVQGDKGDILIGLYNTNDETFADLSKYYKKATLSIDDENLTTTFKELPKGVYAVAIIHDANKNSKLDKNFFGVPTEGYGFSNNLRFRLRGATFEESQFELDGDRKIVIEMGY